MLASTVNDVSHVSTKDSQAGTRRDISVFQQQSIDDNDHCKAGVAFGDMMASPIGHSSR